MEKTNIDCILGLEVIEDEMLEGNSVVDFILEQNYGFDFLYALRRNSFLIGKNVKKLEDNKTILSQKENILESMKELFPNRKLTTKDINFYCDETE